jgi:S-layer protein (TIGR01564 family)
MRNLILIGGPSMNNLTKELHRKLPIQYMTTGRSGFLYSWISNRTYYNKCSVIEAVKNDETSEKITLVVFGLDRDDTKLAIDVLIKFDNSELKEGLKNTKNRSYPARVISEKESKSLIVEE